MYRISRAQTTGAGSLYYLGRVGCTCLRSETPGGTRHPNRRGGLVASSHTIPCVAGPPTPQRTKTFATKMLSFDGVAFANALRTPDTGIQGELINSRISELLRASWADLKPTGITEAILKQVKEFDCSGEVRLKRLRTENDSS